jgi:hypothetical protein
MCCPWLQSDPIIDSVSEALLAADLSLRRLDALMAEELLDLLDLAARGMTQASTTAPQVMRSNTRQTD